jgi:hypothetical protein
MSKAQDLDGSFLRTKSDPLVHLQNAAKTKLPDEVTKVLRRGSNSAMDVVAVLYAHDKKTDNGYWRVALAALLGAFNAGVEIPQLDEDVKTQLPELRKTALKTNGLLFSHPEFLDEAADLMARMEKRFAARQAGQMSDEDGEEDVYQGIASCRFSPVVRFNDERAHVSVDLIVMRPDNSKMVEEDIPAEDLLFLADTILGAALSSFRQAQQQLKEGVLHRYFADSNIRKRSQAIRDQIDALEALLLSLPLAITSDSPDISTTQPSVHDAS